MYVALDATPLSVSTGGIRRYTAEISRALAQEYPSDRFLLVSDQPFRYPEDSLPNLRSAQAAPGFWRRRWWSAGLPRLIRCERVTVFHGTDFAVPYLPLAPSVVMVHDLSPWKHAHWQPGAARIRRRTPALVSLRLATLVLTPSHAVRREVMEYFRLPSARVAVTPLAAGSAFHPAEEGAENPRYILFTGTMEPRKNIGMLIETWQPLFEQTGVELWLAGRKREDAAPLPQLPGLRILGAVEEQDLPALYQHACVCVYPSHYEGFGLPVVESMACGTPVIISRDPALMEVGGAAAIALDAADGAAWRSAMRAMIENPHQRAARRERSLAQAGAYSWRQTAELTRQAYGEAIRMHE